jgi:hypothetical protein
MKMKNERIIKFRELMSGDHFQFFGRSSVTWKYTQDGCYKSVLRKAVGEYKYHGDPEATVTLISRTPRNQAVEKIATMDEHALRGLLEDVITAFYDDNVFRTDSPEMHRIIRDVWKLMD